jgi:hypothetical protein
MSVGGELCIIGRYPARRSDEQRYLMIESTKIPNGTSSPGLVAYNVAVKSEPGAERSES